MLVIWGLETGIKSIFNQLGKDSIAQMQRIQQDNQQRAQAAMQQQQSQKAAEEWAKAEEIRIALQVQAENQRKIIKYEQVLVPGKSARECAGENKVIDDWTAKCMKSHYERMPVNGNQ